MQPHRISVLGDEFIDRQAFDQLRTKNSLLLSIDKNHHVFLLPPFLCELFNCCKFPFFPHLLGYLAFGYDFLSDLLSDLLNGQTFLDNFQR